MFILTTHSRAMNCMKSDKKRGYVSNIALCQSIVHALYSSAFVMWVSLMTSRTDRDRKNTDMLERIAVSFMHSCAYSVRFRMACSSLINWSILSNATNTCGHILHTHARSCWEFEADSIIQILQFVHELGTSACLNHVVETAWQKSPTCSGADLCTKANSLELKRAVLENLQLFFTFLPTSLCTTCLQVVYRLSTSCLQHVYNLSTTCLQVVYNLSTSCTPKNLRSGEPSV